jgi:fatty acid desaturase
MVNVHILAGMSAIAQINSNWLILLFSFLALWLLLLFARRKYDSLKEAKEQLCLAFAGLVALALMEIFATSANLWHYVPGDWPIILWPTYFVAILFGYQLLRLIERLRR